MKGALFLLMFFCLSGLVAAEGCPHPKTDAKVWSSVDGGPEFMGLIDQVHQKLAELKSPQAWVIGTAIGVGPINKLKIAATKGGRAWELSVSIRETCGFKVLTITEETSKADRDAEWKAMVASEDEVSDVPTSVLLSRRWSLAVSEDASKVAVAVCYTYDPPLQGTENAICVANQDDRQEMQDLIARILK